MSGGFGGGAGGEGPWEVSSGGSIVTVVDLAVSDTYVVDYNGGNIYVTGPAHTIANYAGGALITFSGAGSVTINRDSCSYGEFLLHKVPA